LSYPETKTLLFERQSGGQEQVECEEYVFNQGGLMFLRRTTGATNCGVPLLYVSYAVPACDIRWFEEVIPENERADVAS
jgi:hypothetical protein